MNNRELINKSALLQIGIYIDIIDNILIKHPALSVFKLTTFAYIKKNEDNYFRKIYSANNSKDIVFKCISTLTGRYSDYINSLEYILAAIDILIKNKTIYIESDLLYSFNENLDDGVALGFVDKAIRESYSFTDRQFMKEVVHNV